MTALALAQALTPTRALAQATGTVTEVAKFTTLTGTQPLDGPRLKASDGNFYGCTSGGGTNDRGTVYRLTPAGALTVLHSFVNQSGIANPVQEGFTPKELIQGADGNLYGICRGGGAAVNTPAGGGTFFRLGLDGTFTKLYDFDNGPEADSGQSSPVGVFPSAIVQGGDGNFYGLTRDGGNTAGRQGTYFRLSADGRTRTVLFNFQSGNGPGYSPEAQMIVGRDGNFYGLTNAGGRTGGSPGTGTLFMATTAGTVTPIHFFDGDYPPYYFVNALIQGSDGALYGTSTYGGTDSGSMGSIFRCTTDGNFSFLHVFQDPEIDGKEPRGGLVQGSDGNFYGSTLLGFAPDPADLRGGPGSFYQVTPGGAFTTLAKLSLTNGLPQNPIGNLVEVSPKTFFGITEVGSGDDASVVKIAVTGGAAHHPFFAGEVSLGNGVYYLTLPNGTAFGYYSYLSDPHYIFHYDLGYEYVFDTTDSQSGVYFYDFASNSYFYTSPSFAFPYLYDFSLNTTLYYFPDTQAQAPHVYTNNPRFFVNLSNGQIFSK